MPSTDLRPLPSWANTARLTFWTSWTLVPVIAILDTAGLIEASGQPWYALRVVVAMVWTVAGLTWGWAEYQRRH